MSITLSGFWWQLSFKISPFGDGAAVGRFLLFHGLTSLVGGPEFRTLAVDASGRVTETRMIDCHFAAGDAPCLLEIVERYAPSLTFKFQLSAKLAVSSHKVGACQEAALQGVNYTIGIKIVALFSSLLSALTVCPVFLPQCK